MAKEFVKSVPPDSPEDRSTVGSYQQGPPSHSTVHPQHPTSYPHPANYQQAPQYPHPPSGYPHPQNGRQERDGGAAAPSYQPDQVKMVPFDASPNDLAKSSTLAVVLCIPILGLLGLHHFYLNRPYFGYLYLFTLGLFGIGWLADWCRIRSLVRQCNDEAREAQIRGYKLVSPRYPTPLTKLSMNDAFLLWFPPCGLLGFYHFYLGRRRMGWFHCLTFGRCGLGWLFDLCRLSSMVKRANADIAQMKKGIRVSDPPYSVCDAYTLAIPLGVFGLHHFYLGNYKRGFLFLFTVGVFGLGWVADLFQMPMIVAEANKNKELHQRLNNALEQTHTRDTTTVVVTGNQGFSAGPNDSYGTGGDGGTTGVGVARGPPPAYTEQANSGKQVWEGAGGSGRKDMLP